MNYKLSYVGTRGEKEIEVPSHMFPEVIEAYEELQEAGVVSDLRINGKTIEEHYKTAKLN